MSIPVVQVDAFTDRPYRGNPAAVLVLDRDVDEGWMQDVAREMNLSETAFLRRRHGGDGFALRWFTPAVEVDLCGHATLAAAHVLWSEGHLPTTEVARFWTRSGPLSAERAGDRIVLDFPAQPIAPAPIPDTLEEVLGARILSAGTNGMDYLVELEDVVVVGALRPDYGRLRALPFRGVIATARYILGPEYDFVSRFFAPNVGIDEDPVTGSAHCALGPFWGERLGKTELVGYQASPRGGTVHVALAGDRVKLGGQAVTVLRGALTFDPPPVEERAAPPPDVA